MMTPPIHSSLFYCWLLDRLSALAIDAKDSIPTLKQTAECADADDAADGTADHRFALEAVQRQSQNIPTLGGCVGSARP